jgi:hypothetical protein
MRELMRHYAPAAALILVLVPASPVRAQANPLSGAADRPAAGAAQVAPAPVDAPRFGIRGFGQLGLRSFTASRSFDAIFDRTSNPIYGGGVEVRLFRSWFVQVAGERTRLEGERVFVHNGEVFRLGIPTTVTITPMFLTGGYHFTPARRIRPYAGGGFGSYAYEETSQFAAAGENVRERHNGYHILGGAEVGLGRWLAAGVDVLYASVPDALGRDGVSREFNERDLGGTSVRFRIAVGR